MQYASYTITIGAADVAKILIWHRAWMRRDYAELCLSVCACVFVPSAHSQFEYTRLFIWMSYEWAKKNFIREMKVASMALNNIDTRVP